MTLVDTSVWIELTKGYTIRSSTDCLIAAIAIESGVPVWHKDRDFEAFARYTSLRTRRMS
jgi:hypothetical protein